MSHVQDMSNSKYHSAVEISHGNKSVSQLLPSASPCYADVRKNNKRDRSQSGKYNKVSKDILTKEAGKYSVKKELKDKKSVKSSKISDRVPRTGLKIELSPKKRPDLMEVYIDKNEFVLDDKESDSDRTENVSKVVKKKSENKIVIHVDKLIDGNNKEIDRVPSSTSAQIMRNTSNNSGPYCKICYESEQTPDNKLINPCICQGSMKFIHHECLKTWIIKQELANPEEAVCEICKSPYIMRFKMKDEFSKVKCCEYTERVITLMLIVVIIIIITDVLLFVIVSRASDFSEKNKQYLLIALSIFSIVIFLLILLYVIRNYRKACYIKVMEEWRILGLSELESENQSDESSSKIIHYTTNIYINNIYNVNNGGIEGENYNMSRVESNFQNENMINTGGFNQENVNVNNPNEITN